MLKKIFLINPLVYTIIIVGITFWIQFFSGARLAYFVVDVVDSWLEEACRFGCFWEEMSNYPTDCYYYGWCLNMVGEKNIGYMEVLILASFLIFTIIIPFVSWRKFIYMLLWLILSYLIYTSAKGLDWFYNCQDFCGFENILIYPPIFLFIFATLVLLNKFWIHKSLN